MCELLGLSFNQPVRCSLSFRGFRDRGARNPDGWGVARYAGPACQVLKEPVEAPGSRLAEFIRDYDAFTGRVFVAHVRWASRGAVELKNTHPFSRTFRSRDVVFAHNGTVDDAVAAGRLSFHRVGRTDSELLFCALLTGLSERRIAFTDYAQIEGLLRGFNHHGHMNVLFSDGDHLFAYRDQGGYTGLCVTQRRAPFDVARLRDEDWEVDLAEEKRPDQRGYVVATRPLTDERWTHIPPGSLLVVRHGERVYGSS
jgi:predicted glutamine amidotransferase